MPEVGEERVHEIRRDLPGGVATAFAWLTDYSPDDTTLLGRGTAREVTRSPSGEIGLRDFLSREGWESALQGTVTLSPPDSWRYEGKLLVSGREVSGFVAAYRLEPRDHGSRLTVVFRVRAIGEAGAAFMREYEERVWARIERIYDRIVAAVPPG